MSSSQTDKPKPTYNFDNQLETIGLFPLTASTVNTLQINLGKLCNQTCSHCHVDAGPNRTEIMTKDSLDQCLRVIKEGNIPLVDLTGGAPEMNPNFKWFVQECHKLGCHIIVRCNLTIITVDGYEYLPQFYRDLGVEVVASLPCYTMENVDEQRGQGVFNQSIRALKLLNEVGYGKKGSGLELNLVYNPLGPILPGNQQNLQADYKRELQERYSIIFNSLLTITNMPVGRFKSTLERKDQLDDYMNLLVSSFNQTAAHEVMCRSLVSVGWDGFLYDCDFNQMLEIKCDHGAPTHISEFSIKTMKSRQIVTGAHCFGCTAGAGSSCSGALES